MQSKLLAKWKPEPIPKPAVDRRLKDLNELARATECIRYSMLSIEFWISPEGQVREWVKANTRFAVFIAAPTFMAFPVITVALWELSSWMGSLTAIAGKPIVLPVLALLAVVSITIVLKIIRIFKS